MELEELESETLEDGPSETEDELEENVDKSKVGDKSKVIKKKEKKKRIVKDTRIKPKKIKKIESIQEDRVQTLKRWTILKKRKTYDKNLTIL